MTTALHEKATEAAAHPSHPSQPFWEKFGPQAAPSLDGKMVLEIGCGLGARSFECARRGARAIGIDLSERVIREADARRAEVSPELAARLEFRCCPIAEVADDGFDIIFSENAFEHILDVPQVLDEIRTKLKPGGAAYLGFGPLYHSPYGDHGWIQSALPLGGLPWSHLLLPRRLMFKLLSRHYGRRITDTRSWQFQALNQLTVDDFRRLFEASGMEVESFRTGDHKSAVGKAFDLVGRLPLLRKYFTDGIYCVLRKTG